MTDSHSRDDERGASTTAEPLEYARDIRRYDCKRVPQTSTPAATGPAKRVVVSAGKPPRAVSVPYNHEAEAIREANKAANRRPSGEGTGSPDAGDTTDG